MFPWPLATSLTLSLVSGLSMSLCTHFLPSSADRCCSDISPPRFSRPLTRFCAPLKRYNLPSSRYTYEVSVGRWTGGFLQRPRWGRLGSVAAP